MATTPQGPFVAQPTAPPRRTNPWKWVVLGCGGLLLLSVCGFAAVSAGLLGSLTGSTPPTAAVSGGGGQGAAADALAGVGQTSTKGNWAVTLDRVERPAQVGRSTTQPQGAFLVVYVTLKNVGNQSYPIGNNDFTVTNPANNNKYRVASVATGETIGDGYEVIVISKTVQPELTSKAAVVFDVPPDVRDLILDVQGNRFRLPNP